MAPDYYSQARRLRESNVVLLVFVGAVVTLIPTATSFSNGPPIAVSETVVTVSWWLSVALLSAYGTVHVIAAIADTNRFIDDLGTEYGGQALVFCHALGQRLCSLLGAALALVFLAITGAGTEAPLVLLVALGLFAASLIGLSVGIPMNRRIFERLAAYRD
ncbi:hypothetical protein [Halorussus halophilus]|uniref:hypothetical protein n=1 Tax=Halorussus halophilus TaxID=2650975 RepID=UPI001300E3CF|nr:hypothetical protein [Halorussus halophilus]